MLSQQGENTVTEEAANTCEFKNHFTHIDQILGKPN